MRRPYLRVQMILCVTLSVGTAFSAQLPAEQQAVWEFENDYTANDPAWNGMATGNVIFVPGQDGLAAHFDGQTGVMPGTNVAKVDSALSTPNSAYSAGFSIMGWVKPTGPGMGGSILDHTQTYAGCSECGFALRQWRETGDPQEDSLRLTFNDGHSGGMTGDSPTGTLPTGKWTHVAVTWNGELGGGVRYFIDCQPVTTTVELSPNGNRGLTTAGALEVRIGAQFPDSAGGVSGFDGSIDHISFWKGVLTPAEVQDDFIATGGDPYACFGDCGNGVLDPGETCDDGNNDSGDDCPADCTATFSFTKVADTGTSIPGASGTFTDFWYPPAIDEGRVAFHGYRNTGGLEGIYTFDRGVLRRIADENMARPNSPDETFQFILQPSIDGNNVAFKDHVGVYMYSGGVLKSVATTNTAIPGGTGNFSGFGPPTVDGEDVIVHGWSSAPSQMGIYQGNGVALSVIVDLNTPIPGGVGNFTSLGGNGCPTGFEQGNVAFQGEGSGQEGIYTWIDGSFDVVADLNTIVPGSTYPFNDFSLSCSSPGVPLSNGSVVFEGRYSGTRGIYTNAGGSLRAIAKEGDPIPGTSSNFHTVWSPAIDDENVTFINGSGVNAIYTNMGGSLKKVIGVNDVLDGKQVQLVYSGPEGVSGSQIAFRVRFADTTQGIFVASFNGEVGDCDGDGVADWLDNCPWTSNPTQVDDDQDGTGLACECADSDPGVSPDVTEVNDGLDNNCDGAVDEGSRDAVFCSDLVCHSIGFSCQPAGSCCVCWPCQPGATEYEFAVIDDLLFPSCATVRTQDCHSADTTIPLPGKVRYYLHRPVAPFAGSWGPDSTGAIRSLCPTAP